jgi:hypothetical protein
MAYNRFYDAVMIQEGGYSIHDMANALVRANMAAQKDGVQTDKDLAVRLIVAQLAWFCDADGIGGIRDVDYSEAMKKCREYAGLTGKG